MLFTNPQYPTMISEKLYIGNLSVAGDREQLKSLGITHILICASLLDPPYPQVLVFLIKDFIYKNIEVDDLPYVDIKSHFEESYK